MNSFTHMDMSSSREGTLESTPPSPQHSECAPGSASAHSNCHGKEKKKRARVSASQLEQLEHFFSMDRCPSLSRRREISEMLGMSERQTQIWFQNRRAKEKGKDGRYRGKKSGSVVIPSTPPPELSTGFDYELQRLINEKSPITIVPCTDLKIGSWRRLSAAEGKNSLVTYVCDARRSLTWFIRSADRGFKMEIAFDNILNAEFETAASPGIGRAIFILSRPPRFFIERVRLAPAGGQTVREWDSCADWTEKCQASRVLRHNLEGPAIQLAHFLRSLHANLFSPDIQLQQPSRVTSSPSPSDLSSNPLDTIARSTLPSPEPAESWIHSTSNAGPQHPFYPAGIKEEQTEPSVFYQNNGEADANGNPYAAYSVSPYPRPSSVYGYPPEMPYSPVQCVATASAAPYTPYMAYQYASQGYSEVKGNDFSGVGQFRSPPSDQQRSFSPSYSSTLVTPTYDSPVFNSYTTRPLSFPAQALTPPPAATISPYCSQEEHRLFQSQQ